MPLLIATKKYDFNSMFLLLQSVTIRFYYTDMYFWDRRAAVNVKLVYEIETGTFF